MGPLRSYFKGKTEHRLNKKNGILKEYEYLIYDASEFKITHIGL